MAALFNMRAAEESLARTKEKHVLQDILKRVM